MLNESSAVSVIARPGPLDSPNRRQRVRTRPCGSLGHTLWMENAFCLPEWSHIILYLHLYIWYWLVVWKFFLFFHSVGNNHPNWLIFLLRGVETTNQDILLCPSLSLDYRISMSFTIVTLSRCTKRYVLELCSISSE